MGDVERRSTAEGSGDNEQRSTGLRVDLDALEKQAEELYLHRFVTAIKKARGEYGRYLVLRSGDELAIRAAGDGSGDSLEDVSVDGTSS